MNAWDIDVEIIRHGSGFRVTCYDCGCIWRQRLASGLLVRCPECRSGNTSVKWGAR